MTNIPSRAYFSQNVLNRFGLADLANQETYSDLIGGDVSILEVTERITDVYDRVQNADDVLKTQLSTYFPTYGTSDFARALLTGKTPQDMTGKYVWMFLAGLIILMFKSSIEKLAAALFMFIGSDYKEDDVVYVDGKPGRIIRVGLTKTVFFIYDIVDGKVVSGNKLVVQNERLSSLNIEKPLPNLDLSRFKKD